MTLLSIIILIESAIISSVKIHMERDLKNFQFLSNPITLIKLKVIRNRSTIKNIFFGTSGIDSNEPRNVTIYLMRRLRSDTLKAAGEVVRVNKNSTVSSIIDRVKYEMRRDKGIRLSVEKLIKTLSNGQT